MVIFESAQSWFNGELLHQRRDYAGEHTKQDGNLLLMGWREEASWAYPQFGAMSDVNIWNRSLSQVEVERWSRCELETGGNLLDWDTARLDTQGLRQTQVDKSVVCQRKQYDTRLMVFKEKRGVAHKY